MKRRALNYFKIACKLAMTACGVALITMFFAMPVVRAQDVDDDRMQRKTGNYIEFLERQKKAIVGSWLVNVVTPGFPDLKVLLTFEEGGTVVGAAQGDVTSARALSMAQGAWVNKGGLMFGSTFIQISYEIPTSNLRGYLKFKMTHTLDSSWKEWSGPYHFDFVLPNGTVLFSADGTTTAQRIRVEP